MGSKFDLMLWRKRAWKRHNSAIRAGRDVTSTDLAWIKELAYINSLQLIVDWVHKRGVEVRFCRRTGGIYLEDKKEIRVSGRYSPMRQIHVLLHECGHLLIGVKEKTERYGMGYGSTDPCVKRSLHHRIDILDEEMEAWHRGWKLAKRLGALTDLDKADFDKTRVEFLHSYTLWASKSPGYERYDDPSLKDDER